MSKQLTSKHINFRKTKTLSVSDIMAKYASSYTILALKLSPVITKRMEFFGYIIKFFSMHFAYLSYPCSTGI